MLIQLNQNKAVIEKLRIQLFELELQQIAHLNEWLQTSKDFDELLEILDEFAGLTFIHEECNITEVEVPFISEPQLTNYNRYEHINVIDSLYSLIRRSKNPIREEIVDFQTAKSYVGWLLTEKVSTLIVDW